MGWSLAAATCRCYRARRAPLLVQTFHQDAPGKNQGKPVQWGVKDGNRLIASSFLILYHPKSDKNDILAYFRAKAEIWHLGQRGNF